MPKLGRVSGQEAIRALEHLGFVQYVSVGATSCSRSGHLKEWWAALCRSTVNLLSVHCAVF